MTFRVVSTDVGDSPEVVLTAGANDVECWVSPTRNVEVQVGGPNFEEGGGLPIDPRGPLHLSLDGVGDVLWAWSPSAVRINVLVRASNP